MPPTKKATNAGKKATNAGKKATAGAKKTSSSSSSSRARATTQSSENAAKLEDLIDDATELVQKSITNYAKHAKRVATEFADEGKVDAGKLTEEIMNMWVSMATDSTQAAFLWMQGLRLVAQRNTEP
jgi:hypothetical protein